MGNSVRAARALERLAQLERAATGHTRDADVVRNGFGQIRRAARRYRLALRQLHADCYGEAGANVDGWLAWMAREPAPKGVDQADTHEVHDCPGGAYVITERGA